MSLALRTQELQITGTNQSIGCEEVQVNCTGGEQEGMKENKLEFFKCIPFSLQMPIRPFHCVLL